MNPGICYLYEYKNNQKLRNVGFMKVTPHYRSCILQINARGIPVQNGDSIKLLVFYVKDSESIAKPIDDLPCENKNIYARLTVTDSAFPDGKTLEDLGGFLLHSPNGQYYAAVSDNLPFDTEKVKMWGEKSEPIMEAESLSASAYTIEKSSDCEMQDWEKMGGESQNELEEEAPVQIEEVPDEIPDEISTEISSPADLNMQEEKRTIPPSAIPEMLIITEPPVSMPEQPSEAVGMSEPKVLPETQTPEMEPSSSQEPSLKAVPDHEQKPKELVRKIQRSELSMLPRRCWNLANNSFLMHGYHNYNHLLLVEDDGHFWLGVPGIYAPREARAAELFGFPQFTQTYTSQLDLGSDECDSNEKFGYWCRFIR